MSQETSGPQAGNPFCQLQCLNVKLCDRAILRGEMWQAGGDPQVADELLGIEDIEEDTVDGVYTKEESLRIVTLAAPIPPAEAERMRQGGEELIRGFTGLRYILMQTCTEGPDDLGACQSAYSDQFMFTEDDLR